VPENREGQPSAAETNEPNSDVLALAEHLGFSETPEMQTWRTDAVAAFDKSQGEGDESERDKAVALKNKYIAKGQEVVDALTDQTAIMHAHMGLLIAIAAISRDRGDMAGYAEDLRQAWYDADQKGLNLDLDLVDALWDEIDAAEAQLGHTTEQWADPDA